MSIPTSLDLVGRAGSGAVSRLVGEPSPALAGRRRGRTRTRHLDISSLPNLPRLVCPNGTLRQKLILWDSVRFCGRFPAENRTTGARRVAQKSSANANPSPQARARLRDTGFAHATAADFAVVATLKLPHQGYYTNEGDLLDPSPGPVLVHLLTRGLGPPGYPI